MPTDRSCKLMAMAALSAAAAFGPASALPISQNGAGKTIDDLKKDGYTCERVSVNFTECTKPGAGTYWCGDNGECQPAKRTNTGAKNRNPARPPASSSPSN